MSGGARFVQELTEPTLMLPLGITVAVLAAVAGARLWRLWLRFSVQLDVARKRIRSLWRNQPLGACDDLSMSQVPSFAGGVVSLWAPLAVLQIGLYVAQENLEAVLDGARLPGAAPLTGIHWAAAPVHAAVALMLASAATLLARRLHRRRGQVVRLVALAGFVAARIGRQLRSPAPTAAAAPAPLSLFGTSLWRRPPPLLLRTTA